MHQYSKQKQINILPDPSITIGITCYREGDWLRECWESVANQANPRWEAVMILDGSADEKTRAIFDSIEHPRLRKYAMQKNVGPYLCRTQAILNAMTEWYAHLDGDDLLPGEAVALILKAIEGNPQAKFVFGDAQHFSQDVSEIRSFEIFNVESLVYGTNITGTSPIKRTLFLKMGGYASELLNGGADWDFWVGVAEREIVGCRADGVIYKRRMRAGSVGGVRRFTLDKVAQIIIDRHPDFFADNERHERCLGKACEMVARNYRSIGKRHLAAEYARKAIDLGLKTSTLEQILKEQKMNPIRFSLRRLARKLGR